MAKCEHDWLYDYWGKRHFCRACDAEGVMISKAEVDALQGALARREAAMYYVAANYLSESATAEMLAFINGADGRAAIKETDDAAS